MREAFFILNYRSKILAIVMMQKDSANFLENTASRYIQKIILTSPSISNIYTIPVAPIEAIATYIDDLSSLTSFRMAIHGHLVTD